MTERGLAHRESRRVWIINFSTLMPELVDAWKVGETDTYYSTGKGYFSLGIDCHDTFAEVYERCLRLVETSLDDTKRELKRYEDAYSHLLNPDYWKPHLEKK